MSITFLQLAEKVISEEGRPMTANEVWKLAEIKNYIELLNSSGKTPWDTLNAQLYGSVKDKKKSKFGVIGQWVHPDIVGCRFPIQEWSDEVLKISQTVGNNSLILYSFELKLTLNLSSLRENFFQCVSNSSWANESYLVAAEISKNSDFRSELKRLSTSFGIGIIELDVNNPDNSDLLFPAQRRDNLDWETINKLTINTDFKDFLKRIEIDIRSNEIRNEKYDKILSSEQLIKSMNK